MTGKAKTVSQTSIVLAQNMLPPDANAAGNVHGGTIMKLIDNAAWTVACRHTGMNCVTASLDRLDFHSPVYIGNLLFLRASLNRAGSTSMEVGVRVEAEDVRTGEVRHTASAYLTFVALDENKKVMPVPQLVLENDEDCRRNTAASLRYEARKAARQKNQ
nr:acyl-CoA thioesterase [uncultured Holophaga sp.]